MTTTLTLYTTTYSDPQPYLIVCSRADGQSVYEGANFTVPLTQTLIDRLREDLNKAEKFLAKTSRKAEIEARIKAELDAEV